MYIVNFLLSDKSKPLGSDYTRYIHLKTLKGVYARLKNQFIPQNAEFFEIIKVYSPLTSNRKEVTVGLDTINAIKNKD